MLGGMAPKKGEVSGDELALGGKMWGGEGIYRQNGKMKRNQCKKSSRKKGQLKRQKIVSCCRAKDLGGRKVSPKNAPEWVCLNGVKREGAEEEKG